MELKMITPLETALPEKIEFNHEELKAELSEKLHKYNALVVTEDSIKDAKSDRANLNKLLTAVEDKRKEVKKQCLAPYEAFEKKIKELTSMIQQPITAIDVQLKVYEDLAKEGKTIQIAEFFNEQIGELSEIISLDKLWNPKWLNVTYKLQDIQQEIIDTVFKVRNDLKVITAMRSDYELQMKDKYLQAFDMSAALAEKNRLEEQKAKLDELSRKQAEPEVHVIDANHGFENVKPGDIIRFGGNPVTPEPQEFTKTIKVIFHDTTEAFRHEMRALTEKHHIVYGGIN